MNVFAGKLRTRGVIQAPTSTISQSGAISRTYATKAVRWMEVDPRDVQSQPWEGHVMHVVRMRHFADLRREDRILVPRRNVRLSAGINASATQITTSIAVGKLPDQGRESANTRLRIGDELVAIVSGEGTTTLTVERGADGTTAASHDENALVQEMGVFEVVAFVDPDERRRETLANCTEVV